MNFKSTLRLAAAISIMLSAAGAAVAAPAASLWADVAAREIPLVGLRQTTPLKARTITMDAFALQAKLAEAQGAAKGAALPVLRLPLPQGGELAFAIRETQVMSPKLAAKYPQIRTYQGTVADKPGVTGRFQMDPRGFRAMIFTLEGTYYIDSYSRGDARNYQVYYASDLPQKARPGDEVLPRLAPLMPKKSSLSNGLAATANKGVSISGELRTYRLALAANFEYSSYHDPIVPPDNLMPRIPVVLAELVNVTNRVSGVYERELGIRLQLVDNNDQIIFNTPASPYADADGQSMLVTNIAVVNALIGIDNYDIGHVTSTGGGGVAFLGVVCGLQKAGGVTGSPAPIGDDYYIDYVAHEMGHQFGGNHTFNGSTGSCAGGNRNATTAYEPGSGITIMAYAGICSPQDVAPHSIDTFHAASFDEIVAFSRDTAEGASCGTASTSANRPPLVVKPVGGFTIPKSTPFELTGAASDPDGDTLRYQWEEFDLGATGAPNAAATVTATTPPLFRPFRPTLTPTRVFPQISDIVGNTQTIGEILPAVGRAMKFRLTVRDNFRIPTAANPDTTASFEAGGVASEDLAFTVSGTAGPFLVTFPTATGLSFNGRSTQTITWDAAGTTAAPISCANVDIFMSTDGGFTYPTTLISGTPNDGNQALAMPNIGTSMARVKVKCANNVFFDISNNNFTIFEIVNNAPSAVLTAAPVSGTAPLTVSFDGLGSSDADDSVGSYNFGFGEGAATGFQTGSSAVHTYNTPGTYTATLQVKDSFGLTSSRAATQTIQVTAAVLNPTAFTFIRRVDVPLKTIITSEAVTLSGFTGSLPVSVSSDGQYSINRGAYTSATGGILAGDTLTVRHTSAATGATETSSSVTVGGYSTPFVSLTTTDDRVPDAFNFGTKTEVAPGTVITSDELTLTGYNAPAPIVAGPGLEYSLDGAVFTRASGNLPVGGKLRVRHTSSASSLGYTKTYLKVGGVSGFFTTRTRK